jgi:hypothetical protein
MAIIHTPKLPEAMQQVPRRHHHHHPNVKPFAMK